MTYGNFQPDHQQQLRHESNMYPTKSHYEQQAIDDFALAPAPVLRGSELFVPSTPTTKTMGSSSNEWGSPASSSLLSFDTPTKDVMVNYEDQDPKNSIFHSLTSPSSGEPGKVPEEVSKMKKNRKRRTVVAGVTGGVVGLVALGPVGMVFGGVGGAVGAKVVGKRLEKRKMEKIAAQNLRQELLSCPSSIKVHDATFS